MRHFAANYIFDGAKLIKNSLISVNDAGEICYIGKENEGLTERPFMIFYNGIICPGMVNAHCHLELSDFEKKDEAGKGMTHFIKSIISRRNSSIDLCKLRNYDSIMFEKGINLVGDIVNTNKTIEIKVNSKIIYHNFIEVSGIKISEADNKSRQAEQLQLEFTKSELKTSIIAHSFYSISPKLLDYVIDKANNNITSIHFLESVEELEFFEQKENPLRSFIASIDSEIEPIANSIETLYSLPAKFNNSISTILVHCTELKLEYLKSENKYYYCLCPASNQFLHNQLPHKELIYNNLDYIVIGTDSLASNSSLDILKELQILEETYSNLNITDLLKFATKNGAEALQKSNFGQFAEGNKPGIILVENCDLLNLKLTHSSRIKRII